MGGAQNLLGVGYAAIGEYPMGRLQWENASSKVAACRLAKSTCAGSRAGNGVSTSP